MSSGKWLVLTRTRSMLDSLEDILRDKGFYYENRFKKLYEKEIQIAATNWEYLIKGQMLDSKQIENISKYMKKCRYCSCNALTDSKVTAIMFKMINNEQNLSSRIRLIERISSLDKNNVRNRKMSDILLKRSISELEQ